VRPSLPEVLASAVPFAVPLRMPFRGVTRRLGLLIEGPTGWGEFAPFDDYPPARAARWLEAAIEAAYAGWPAPVRDWVAVNAIVPAVPAEQVAGLLAATSPATVKVKVTADISADEARVAAVRAAVGPDARIRLDVNAGWTMAQALAELPILDRAAGGVEYVEQPLASLAQIAELRRSTGIPVAVDESIRLAADPFDPALLAQVRAGADVAVLKVAPLGGVRVVLRLAELLGMPVVISGAMDTSVGLAAGIAAAVALPAEPLACGLGTGTLLAGDVVCLPVVPRTGRLAPMRVTPDQAALRVAAAALQPGEARALTRRLQTAWECR
jgi:o-succinylbenzoate synthase